MAAEPLCAMVGYYPPPGGVYAVGNPGITLTKAREPCSHEDSYSSPS
jgi:hypothetical protein